MTSVSANHSSGVRIAAIDAVPARFRRNEPYLGESPSGATEAEYFVRPPYRALYSAFFETLFVRLTLDDGTIGWGEALAPVSPRTVGAIVEDLLAPVLIGTDPLHHDVAWSRMYGLMRERGHYGGFMLDAISACDIAMWDARGKVLGQPVSTLLGGTYHDPIPCYVSGLPEPTDDRRVALAETWASRGFHRFKLAAGFGVDEDVRTLRALPAALGPESALLLDAHWVYGLDEAIVLGRRLEDLGIAAFEAPMNPEDVRSHARLADSIAVPVAIGETERTRFQYLRWLEAGAADLLQPDVGRTGIADLVKIAGMAEASNVPIAPHQSVGLGPCIAASIHVAAAIPNLYLLEYQPPVVELANELLASPLACDAGAFSIPDGPGLGIDLDERRLADLQA